MAIETLPTTIPVCNVKDCSHTGDCIRATWWDTFKITVNELLFLSNTHSCKKDCKNNKHRTCKACFPRKTFILTEIDSSIGAINMKKGEAQINIFSPVVTYLLQCNIDITCLLSGTAIKFVIAYITNYITNYITKPTLKTHTMF